MKRLTRCAAALLLLTQSLALANELVVGVIASRNLSAGAAQTLVASAWSRELASNGGIFGSQVKLLLGDDDSDAAAAAAIAREQVANGALVLVCCTTSAATRAVAGVAEEEGVTLLAMHPENSDRRGSTERPYWHFSVAASDGDILAATVAHLYEQGLPSLGIIAPDLPLSSTVASDAQVLGALVGVRVAHTVVYPAGQAELRPEALLLASYRPSAVLVWGLADDIDIAVSALHRRGFEGAIYTRLPAVSDTAGVRGLGSLTGLRVAAPPAAVQLSAPVASTAQTDGRFVLGPCTLEAVAAVTRLSTTPSGTAQALATAPMLGALDVAALAFEQLLALQLPPLEPATVRQALRDALVGLPPVCTGAGALDLEDGRLSAVRPNSLVVGEIWSGGLRLP